MKRMLSSAALSFLMLPAASCINLDLVNGEENVFEAQIDTKGAGIFRDKNVKFKQIVTLDPLTDEQRAGAVVTDEVLFENISIEFSYIIEEMVRLEELIAAAQDGDVVADPRGDIADPTVFNVGEGRVQPYVVTMVVTYAREEKILQERLLLNNRFKEVRIRTIESGIAFCNFIDPVEEVQGCLKFAPSEIGNLIGRVAGVGTDANEDGILDPEEVENTSVGEFSDLIVIDNSVYADLFQAALEEGRVPEAEDLQDSILIRIARDQAGTFTLFNANLAEDFR